jgi:hypothetical protein
MRENRLLPQARMIHFIYDAAFSMIRMLRAVFDSRV